MTEDTSPPGILDFAGPEGETIFYRMMLWCLPHGWGGMVQAELDDAFAHMASEDDRALALIGALLVENAVDGILAAYIPGYKDLKDAKDFTFSMKISLARALKLCPTRFLGAADAIRNIRNDFAHRLAIARFEQCKPQHLRSLEGHLLQIDPASVADMTLRNTFKMLVYMIFVALRGYGQHVQKLNSFVRSAETFQGAFRDYCTANLPQS